MIVFEANPRPRPTRIVAPEIVADAVHAVTGYTLTELASPARRRDVTYARHLAFWALQTLARRGPAAIGRQFGGRDHSTVLGGIRRIEREARVRVETARDMRAIAEYVR